MPDDYFDRREKWMRAVLAAADLAKREMQGELAVEREKRAQRPLLAPWYAFRDWVGSLRWHLSAWIAPNG